MMLQSYDQEGARQLLTGCFRNILQEFGVEDPAQAVIIWDLNELYRNTG